MNDVLVSSLCYAIESYIKGIAKSVVYFTKSSRFDVIGDELVSGDKRYKIDINMCTSEQTAIDRLGNGYAVYITSTDPKRIRHLSDKIKSWKRVDDIDMTLFL